MSRLRSNSNFVLFQTNNWQCKANGKNTQVSRVQGAILHSGRVPIMNIDIHHQALWKEMSFEISRWYCEGKECFLLKRLGTLLRKLCKYSKVSSDLWSVQDHADHTVEELGSTQRVTKHLYMTCMRKGTGIFFCFSKS